MNDALQLVGCFAAGVLLGVIFFWALWMTVRDIGSAERRALRLMTSLMFRFGVVLFALYVLLRYGGWPHALAATLGFTLVRLIVVRRLQARPGREGSPP